MRTITTLAVHCSATPEGRDIGAAEIRKWHVEENGWSDIGYHFIIRLDGTMEQGRPIQRMGAHVKGHNGQSIGICYVGGCDKDMNPKDTRTDCQKEQLVAILKQLKAQFPKAIILGHRDFPGVEKSCPSFDAQTEYQYL